MAGCSFNRKFSLSVFWLHMQRLRRLQDACSASLCSHYVLRHDHLTEATDGTGCRPEESERPVRAPGELLSADSFFIGSLKGVGKV